jgi:small subunit ribosomal protein S6
MRNYEMTYILHMDSEEEGLADVRQRIGDVISAGGGEVLDEDLWGRRRLAYPIEKQRDGFYVLMRFSLEPPHLPELERVMALDSRVLRHLLIRTDE